MAPNFFSSIIDASVNLARTFPLRMKKKMLNIWIDLENFKVLFLRLSRELGFLCDCIIGVCSLNVLKNICLSCYCLKRTSLTVIRTQLKFMLWKFV